eukprot:TRINITY_DN12525_c0_g1_i2.p1 TRINITY_DN12525_c0_g1~~TRINITY_DN12525_c0_g1_i2.p1  ORF type:complete len:801 (-),score=104.41 TRINITY_DN12525_c0_g1_i2:49-2451(-)
MWQPCSFGQRHGSPCSSTPVKASLSSAAGRPAKASSVSSPSCSSPTTPSINQSSVTLLRSPLSSQALVGAPHVQSPVVAPPQQPAQLFRHSSLPRSPRPQLSHFQAHSSPMRTSVTCGVLAAARSVSPQARVARLSAPAAVAQVQSATATRATDAASVASPLPVSPQALSLSRPRRTEVSPTRTATSLAFPLASNGPALHSSQPLLRPIATAFQACAVGVPNASSSACGSTSSASTCSRCLAVNVNVTKDSATSGAMVPEAVRVGAGKLDVVATVGVDQPAAACTVSLDAGASTLASVPPLPRMWSSTGDTSSTKSLAGEGPLFGSSSCEDLQAGSICGGEALGGGPALDVAIPSAADVGSRCYDNSDVSAFEDIRRGSLQVVVPCESAPCEGSGSPEACAVDPRLPGSWRSWSFASASEVSLDGTVPATPGSAVLGPRRSRSRLSLSPGTRASRTSLRGSRGELPRLQSKGNVGGSRSESKSSYDGTFSSSRRSRSLESLAPGLGHSIGACVHSSKILEACDIAATVATRLSDRAALGSDSPSASPPPAPAAEAAPSVSPAAEREPRCASRGHQAPARMVSTPAATPQTPRTTNVSQRLDRRRRHAPSVSSQCTGSASSAAAAAGETSARSSTAFSTSSVTASKRLRRPVRQAAVPGGNQRCQRVDVAAAETTSACPLEAAAPLQRLPTTAADFVSAPVMESLCSESEELQSAPPRTALRAAGVADLTNLGTRRRDKTCRDCEVETFDSAAPSAFAASSSSPSTSAPHAFNGAFSSRFQLVSEKLDSQEPRKHGVIYLF